MHLELQSHKYFLFYFVSSHQADKEEHLYIVKQQDNINHKRRQILGTKEENTEENI